MRSAGIRLFAEWLRIWRSRGVVLALVAFLGCAALATHLGRVQLADARADFQRARGSLDEQLATLRATHGPEADLGYMAYYLEMPAAFRAHDAAALARGVSDTMAAVQRIRLLGLIPQLHEDTMENPTARAAGPLDLSFVMAMLAPLLLLVLGYDGAGREDDLGTASLVDALPRGRARMACERVLLAGAVVTGLVVLTSLVAWLVTVGTVDWHLVAWLAAEVTYLSFWTLVLAAVTLATRTSAGAALACVAVWLALCVLLPAAINGLAAQLTPSVGAGEILLAQRERMNDAWDEPKAAAMAPFFRRWPQLADTEVPDDRFSWMWYYAMHDNADASVAGLVTQRKKALFARERWIRWASFATPAAALQQALAEIAGTDAAARDAHGKGLQDYHDALEKRVFPLIFAGAKLSALVPRDLPDNVFMATTRVPRADSWLALLAANLAASALALIAWRRRCHS